jgi:N-acetylglucosaminyl-diphospho-decaprenol L-rhamnosyltransferase
LTSVEEVSVIVAAHNARPYVERTLRELVRTGHELILVDCASHDGTAAVVREGFPAVRLIQLDSNKGYGAALNEGVKAASGTYFLFMNADAWPIGQAVERLLAFATAEARLGAVGPRLRNADGSLQRSVRGFPTLWRLATEYFFLRWLAPRSRFLNAFYSAQFDHESTRDAEFLVGAVLLVGRKAFEDVGGFDPAFFMYNEEVDLCYRLRRAGWRVVFFPGAEFVHLGGASTRSHWDQMYREQLRSHLRFLQKHHGRHAAERAHRLLLLAMRMRARIFRGERRRVSRNAADWLASGDTAALLNDAAEPRAM